jgi:hypothetical protein
MTTSAYRPRMCDDLIHMVLSINDEKWWPRDLRNLALVSRAGWLQLARKRLYACPVIHTFRACHLLARTLRDHPQLGQLLQCIDLRPLGDGVGSPTEMASLRFLLAVQHAQKIVLAGELAFKAERCLQAFTSPFTLVELCIDGYMVGWKHEACCHRYASLRWDASVAAAFPHLNKLRLSTVDIEIDPSASISPIRPTEITLNNVHFIGDVRHFADFTSVRSLQVVCECGIDFNPSLKVILFACANTVETLSYEVQHSWHEEGTLLQDTTRYPSLRQLSLNSILIGRTDLESTAERSPALEVLAVGGRWSHITASEWIEFIKSGLMSRLHCLGTPKGTFSRPWTPWSSAMIQEIGLACRTRTIDMRT